MKKIYFLLLAATILTLSTQAQSNRSYDGSANNLSNPTWGAAHSPFQRVMSNGYADAISMPSGSSRPSARMVSVAISKQDDFIGNPLNISDFGWTWGQFIDHDINFNDDHSTETFPISVPACDYAFDPMCTGAMTINMKRSDYDPASGTSPTNPRKHLNLITHWIDGSNVYGSDTARANWLRSFIGGKMKVSAGNFLPFNTLDAQKTGAIDTTAPFMIIEGMPMAKFFIAGDLRANEQPTLACMHTLFVREHNRLCDELAIAHPTWNDEQLYQYARKKVSALIQVITYQEFLPTLGISIDPYSGYDASVNGSIMNTFSAAAYRIGHTLVNEQLVRLENDGDTLSFGSVHIKNAFFNPYVITDEGGIAPYFKGMASQRQQTFDTKVVTALRDFLFGLPGYGGFDLVSLNVQRARERGLPDYNTIRTDMGLSAITNFSDISSNAATVDSLQAIYASVNDIDPWIGMVSEDHMPGTSVGETMHDIIKHQFELLRDGDRFYYENDLAFNTSDIEELQATTLADIIRRNCPGIVIQDDVFHAKSHGTLTTVEILPFANIRKIDIKAYPNPVQNKFKVEIMSMRSEAASFKIVDLSGRVLMQEQMEILKGENTFYMELDEQYASGLYTIVIETEDNRGQLVLVKQ